MAAGKRLLAERNMGDVPARALLGRKRVAVSRVAILGCGPAGLVAAHAAISLGFEVVIISNTDEPSQLHGCQYLHAPVPGYEDVPHVRVSYELRGSVDQYRHKVYGYKWEGKVSPEDFAGEHDAWDIRETYRRLWDNIITKQAAGLIVKRVVMGKLPFVTSLHPDHIISTIPAQALCVRKGTHRFNGHAIWANGSTSAGISKDNSIVCDGTPEVPWYRMSNVFGYLTTEWAGHIPPPRWQNAAPVVKPLSTDCDCHPEVIRVGRYGTYEKARLVHEVYPAVAGNLGDPSAMKYEDGTWHM
jgi:hypothetical protein